MHIVRNPFVGGVVALLAMVFVLSAGNVALGEDIDPDVFRQFDVGNGNVSIDVQDARFGDVVSELIQPQTRVNIFVTPEAAEQTVTARALDLHWSLVLSELTTKINGVLVVRDRNLIQIQRPRPFSYTFENQDLVEVVRAIVDFAGANVIVSPKVAEEQKKLTLVLNDTPWLEALKQAVRTAGPFALVEENYGILRVVHTDDLELETDYYRFLYLRPPAPYRGILTQVGTGGSSGGGGAGGGGGGGGQSSQIIQHDVFVPTDDPKSQEELFPIVAALREIVIPDNGTVTYIPTNNSIIFTGTKPRIRRLREMVGYLDIEPPQVFIDMNFIVTTNQDAINLGLDPGTSAVGLSTQGADILTMLPFAFGNPGGLEEVITGTEFNPVPASSFQYGRLNTSQTSFLWNFIQSDSSSNIVQAPKLLALDNQEATIFVGESVRWARSTAATNENGGLTFGIEEDPNSPVNVGFQLLVIPHVIPGEQKIMMTVIPTRSTLTGNTSTLPGFDRFVIGDQSIDLPRVQSNTLLTHMILQDGETAVIGGLLEDTELELQDKVPFFGDLPLAGLLFQGKETTRVKEHLLITITPRILKGTDAANCVISDELLGRAESVATEYNDLFGQGTKDAAEAARSACDPAPRCGVPVAPRR